MKRPPHDEHLDHEALAFPLDGEAGPAHHITRAKADAMVQRALAQAGFGAVLHDDVRSTADIAGAAIQAPRRKRAFKTSYLVAAILMMGVTVGSASAAVLWYARARESAPIAERAAPRSERAAKPRRAPTPTPVATEAVAPEPAVEPSPEPPPTAPTRERPPEDWLIEGNRLRAAKSWQKAEEAYTRALRAAPNSETRYVAQVASAAVRLEHLRNPRGALRRYRAALRANPGGPLDEEVLFGIAEAHRALGDRAAEQAALAAFLRAHPHSPLADQARARLE